ncbi:gamma-glutamylcyclotransferase [Marinobacter sp. R17]|uniref:gamma-glutamylcyclotransferase family protein n=1 Tax=Marinobacter sp. R17 TaxID=2484250 RepID=UPI000F4B8573|nr:gamma-glutamylcyclotransferase family protein [Marinobacter sp. R17]ROU02080.1 gamma-glutamylcyclotransferase [Marinobacter sp. R17]
MLCFAYGSNMSRARLLERIPAARFVTVAAIEGYRLCFHKRSRRDGSAKCDALWTGDPADRLHGVVYDIPERDKRRLDRIEGVGGGYEEAVATARTNEGRELEVRLYVATDIDPSLRPLDWYRHHVLVGAQEHALPESYIARIEAIAVDKDADDKRRERELAIYSVR